MKKWCKMLAALMLATSLLVPSPAWAVGRDDKINALKNEGVVTGYPDGSLGLDRPISRAEVSVLLIRMTRHQPKGRGAQIFKDVPSSHWASGYVQTACRLKNPQGVSSIVGYPDGTFRPANPVTNAEMMKMLTVAAKDGLSPEDVKGATWPTSWIRWADELGIVGAGSDVNASDAKAPATRGDVFVMIYNAGQSVKPRRSKPAPAQPAPAIPARPAKPAVSGGFEFNAFNSGRTFDHEKFNREFLALINADRTKRGLVPLKWGDDLTPGATTRVEELLKNGSIDVNGQDHVRLDGRSWVTAFDYIRPKLRTTICGENLAEIINMSNERIGKKSRLYMTDEQVLAENFYRLWWNSPGHRENMMEPKYRYINLQVRVGNYAQLGKPGKNIVYFVGTTHFRGDYR